MLRLLRRMARTYLDAVADGFDDDVGADELCALLDRHGRG